jgi:putative membrane protein
MRFAFLFALTAFGLAVAGLSADEPRRTATADDERFTDTMFVEKVSVGGMFEVKSSQLAQQKGGNRAVKDFAERMIADHTAANGELARLAEEKRWQTPTALDTKHQEMLDQLRKAQAGDQFDRLYADVQVKAHDKTVALFEKAGQDAQDSDLKAWVTKTLPTLKEHQQMAKQLSASGTGPAAATTIPPASRTAPPR